MRALLQRVHGASVSVDGSVIASITRGLLVYLGIRKDDEAKDLEWMARKVLHARVFENADGKMANSVLDMRGEILVVSQITLYGEMLEGNRPDMGANMGPEGANQMYEAFTDKLKEVSGLKVEKGAFGAHMDIQSVNDGPITIWLDSLPAR